MAGPRRLGDFEIVEEIGRGGFGVVYRARQVSLDRPVALKVLYRNLIHTQEQISRFEREARAAARLEHPSIVSVYAWGEADDDFYIAQQLIGRGRTLADWLAALREGSTVPTGYFRRAAEVMAEVAEGLEHSHRRGIVHRDIKPSNILLDDDEQPFLGDFGLAKVEDGLDLSRTGTMAGSPYYMSPEQADAERGTVGPQSDVYSLGVSLYEMLTLTQPFGGTTPHEIMRKILTAEPRPPSQIQPRVPEDLETICLKAMEKVPERRYADAAAMASDLRAYLAGEPISAVPISATRRTLRRMRRHRVPLIVGVVALATVAGVSWWFLGDASQKQDEATLKAAIHDAEQLAIEEVERDIDDRIVAAAQAGDMDLVVKLVQEKQGTLATVRQDFDKALAEAETLGASFTRSVTNVLKDRDTETALGAISDVVSRGLGLSTLQEALTSGRGPPGGPPETPTPGTVAAAVPGEVDATPAGATPGGAAPVVPASTEAEKPYSLFGIRLFGGNDEPPEPAEPVAAQPAGADEATEPAPQGEPAADEDAATGEGAVTDQGATAGEGAGS